MKPDKIDGVTGVWIAGVWHPSTCTIVPSKPEERWFVYDPGGDGYEEFRTEQEAHDRYIKCIQDYRYEAYEGWADEVTEVVWGQVFQTTHLIEIEPNWDEIDPEDYDRFEGMDTMAEAYAMEHRVR